MIKDFQYFQEKYRNLFPQEPRCGFDLPEGWGQLFEDLCDQLSKLQTPPKCAQVKEKFGGLRFYCDSEPAEAGRFIDEAERRSYGTCQICGSEEEVKNRGGGWIIHLCPVCWENHINDI